MQEKNQFDQLLGKKIENWQPLEKPAKTNINGIYCMLQPFDIDQHATKLFHSLQIKNHAGETWTYLPYGPFVTLDEFLSWLQMTIMESGTQLYAILNAKTLDIVGICGYLRMTPEHGVIEIGHVHFSKLLQKTRAATETIYLLLQKVFDELHYRRCEWKCNALNHASRNAALRFGFTFEGIFRQHFVFKNRNRDTAWFSIIDDEWPQIKMKFQRWLSPNNFDENGKQLASLRNF